jgi:hypothetical protein
MFSKELIIFSCVLSSFHLQEWDPIAAGKQLPFAETLTRFIKTIQEHKDKKVVSSLSLL